MRQTVTDLDTLKQLLPSWLGRPFAFDVETSGLSWKKERLLGLSLTFSDTESYYVVLRHTMQRFDDSIYVHEFIDDKLFAQTVAPLFAQPDPLMVAHHAKFDTHFLARLGIEVRGRLFDTMLAAHLLNENRDVGLKELASLVNVNDMPEYSTMIKYPGYTKKDILGVPLPDVSNYAMLDTEVTLKLHKKFSLELAEEEMEDLFYNTWMPLLTVLQQMEARGIALDLDTVRSVREQYLAIALECEARVRQDGIKMILDRHDMNLETLPSYYLRYATDEELADAYETQDGTLSTDVAGVSVPILTKVSKAFKPRVIDFSTGSSKQLKELIMDHLGIKVPDNVRLKMSEKTKEVSLDKDNLNTLLFYNAENPPQTLVDVLEWRKAEKFINTYLDRFLLDADPDDYNSISTSFNQDGTATGRFSSSNPNLQNIPSRGEVGKQARSMFVARPGYVLLVGDLGQAELRMLAHFSEDEALKQAFAEDKDLHILTGAAFARVSYEELYEKYHSGDLWGKDMRALGKTGNFALTYGMGPAKFQRYLLVNNKYEVTVDQAGQWIKGYNEMYEGATRWKQRVVKYAQHHGYILTIRRRKRRLPDIWSEDRKLRSYAERQGINAAIQGSVGDVISESMIPIQKVLRSVGGTLLLQVHDELVAEVPEDVAPMCKEAMEFLMVYNINKILRVPQVSDVHQGTSWGSAKN